MTLLNTFNSKLQHPIFESLAKLIKMFKSSKSFYSIFYILALFTIQQAIAWKYGTAISSWFTSTGEEWYYQLGAFVFEHGSIELVVLGVVLIVVLSLVEMNSNQKTTVNQNNTLNINGDNSWIANNGHHNTFGITDSTLKQILKTYQDKIDDLEVKLSNSTTLEEKYKLSYEINELKKSLHKKTQEVEDLQKTLDGLTLDIAIEAKDILDKEGINQVIEYLQRKKAQDKQKQLDKNMQEFAQKFKMEAQLLIVESRYSEAKEAYQQMIKYDRSFNSLFEYAYFLQIQNFFEEATKEYETLLTLRLTQEQRARILNNLATLYYSQNKNKEALEAYKEVGKLYSILAKRNPDIVNKLNILANLFNQKNKNQEVYEACDDAENYRKLLKMNPYVYSPDIAIRLKHLAIFYQDQNKKQKALKSYQEVEQLYKVLIKNNLKPIEELKKLKWSTIPTKFILRDWQYQYSEFYKKTSDVYELGYLKILIMGILYFNQNKKDLEEAKTILSQKQYRDVYQAQQLLKIIEEIEKGE